MEASVPPIRRKRETSETVTRHTLAVIIGLDRKTLDPPPDKPSGRMGRGLLASPVPKLAIIGLTGKKYPYTSFVFFCSPGYPHVCLENRFGNRSVLGLDARACAWVPMM